MKRSSQGDTIIEVILAVTVFSAIAVGAIIIMNSGISTVQRSLEVTLARQQIDTQAEMLRYVYDRSGDDDAHYVTLWNNVKSIHLAANPQNLINIDSCPGSIAKGFVFTPASGGSVGISTNYSGVPDTYAKLAGNVAQGISIQVTKVADAYSPDVGAYDAYIQACWQASGGSRPVTIGTIVRLYEAN